jgi:hypothetical protein
VVPGAANPRRESPEAFPIKPRLGGIYNKNVSAADRFPKIRLTAEKFSLPKKPNGFIVLINQFS